MYKKDPLLKINTQTSSPHNIIPRLVNANSEVLDVGCNTGFIGKKLLEKNVITDGIDINDKALKIASKFYQHTYKRDLYIGKLDIPRKKYDYIIFADILEHLPRPDLVLQDSAKYLKKEGSILISLPNIARLEIRLKLLLGSFDYTYGGILSEDHLRFFTRKTANDLINKSGYTVINTIPTGLGYHIRPLSSFLAFQFVYICKHSDGKPKIG